MLEILIPIALLAFLAGEKLARKYSKDGFDAVMEASPKLTPRQLRDLMDYALEGGTYHDVKFLESKMIQD